MHATFASDLLPGLVRTDRPGAAVQKLRLSTSPLLTLSTSTIPQLHASASANAPEA